jgi:tricarballylate dehydrogenase
VAYHNLDDIRKVVTDLSEEEAEAIVMPDYNEDDFYEDIMRVTKGESQPDLAKQLVDRSFETLVWMKGHGVKFELNYDNQSYEKDGKRQFWGGLPVKTENKGIGLMKQLFSRAEELGIDIWYETAAVELVKRGDKVNGVIVQQGDDRMTVESTGVILACGSFEANKKLRSEYIGKEWEAAIVRGTEYNTGDGISMAVAAGAQKFGEYSGCHSIGTDYHAPKVGDFNKPGDIFKKHSYPLSIMLNKEGMRFVDEGADFRNYTYAKYGREILKQPGHMAYQIYDSQVRPLLRKEYDLEEATWYKGETLDELVNQLSVNKQQFLQTIEDYNASVQDGEYNPTEKDGKKTVGLTPEKTNWALKIEEGPFYAFPVTCGITFSFGGLRVSSSGEVLNKKNKPLSGLFAAGEMVGGIFYHNYPGGSGLMSGAVYGKLAGSAAARYALSNKQDSKIIN